MQRELNREKFLKAQNYALYYGIGREETLSRFDVAIVEPLAQNAESLQRLKESGTLVLAYLSALEIHPSSPDFKFLKEEDFITLDTSPLMNPAYGTCILNPRSKRWSGLLFHSAGKLFYNAGYDGVFLDTIGDVELHEIPRSFAQTLIPSAVDLVRQIRSLDDDIIIVQNNGLEKLCLYTSRLVDGICWENPPFSNPESAEWNIAVISRLNSFRERQKLQVMLLVEETAEKNNLRIARKTARENGYLLYSAPRGYVSGINENPTGDGSVLT